MAHFLKGWFLKVPRVPLGPFVVNFGKRGVSSISFRVKHGKQSASWSIWSRTRQTGLSSINGPGFLNYQRNMPSKHTARSRNEEGSITAGATIGAFLLFILKGALGVVAFFTCATLALMADII